MNATTHELANLEILAPIAATGAPVLPVTASVEPELVLLDDTKTGPKAKDLEPAENRFLGQFMGRVEMQGGNSHV